jgi:hypothetical protein
MKKIYTVVRMYEDVAIFSTREAAEKLAVILGMGVYKDVGVVEADLDPPYDACGNLVLANEK